MSLNVSILTLTSDIYELHWSEKIDQDILFDIIKVKNQLRKEFDGQLINITNTYHIVGIYLKPSHHLPRVRELLTKVLEHRKEISLPKRHSWLIPVCYDPQLAPDLEAFLSEKDMNLPEFIDLHSEKDYLHYFTGFLPGFLYLGGLDERLFLPRKKTPDRTIPKGAVAIGGKQTGIYPNESPGGWHIIGKTPVEIFSPEKERLVFQPGDLVKFKPVSLKEFMDIQRSTESATAKIIKNG